MNDKIAPPEDVRRYVMNHIRNTRLSIAEIGRRMGYADGAYAGKMLTIPTDQYFTPAQAFRIHEALGLSHAYLTGGVGSPIAEERAATAGDDAAIAPPEEVLSALFSDLARRGITLRGAAATLGYATTQSLYLIRNGGQYLGARAAQRFAQVYGYDELYLMTGRGTLSKGNTLGAVAAELEREIARLRDENAELRRRIEEYNNSLDGR